METAKDFAPGSVQRHDAIPNCVDQRGEISVVKLDALSTTLQAFSVAINHFSFFFDVSLSAVSLVSMTAAGVSGTGAGCIWFRRSDKTSFVFF